MKTDRNIIEAIQKLFGGNYNHEETKELNSWYNSFDSSEEIVVDSEESKEEVKARMQARLLDEIGRKKKSGLKLFLFQNNYWKAAAAISTIFILSLSLYVMNSLYFQKMEKIAWIEKRTGMGEKIEVILNDGSKIMLNAGSKIKYPAKSNNGISREVFLEGEAFFDVVHIDKKPFVVHSGGITIKDIGTKFDVKKYDGENETLVSLVEGEVEVTIPASIQRDKQKKYLLLKQQLSYSLLDQTIVVKDFEENEAVGWMNNILVFKKEPLEQVAQRLERNFGVKFEFTSVPISKKELTANFRNESFLTVAEAIKKVTGCNYKTVKANNRTTKIIFL